MGVLAVQVDQLACGIGETRHRGRTPVDVGARPATRRHDPGEHDLATAVDEASVDPRLVGPVAHDGGLGATADHELERLDEHRLAGAGLPGDRGQSRAEHQLDPLDDAEVLDVQLGEHGATGPPARTWT